MVSLSVAPDSECWVVPELLPRDHAPLITGGLVLEGVRGRQRKDGEAARPVVQAGVDRGHAVPYNCGQIDH